MELPRTTDHDALTSDFNCDVIDALAAFYQDRPEYSVYQSADDSRPIILHRPSTRTFKLHLTEIILSP